MFKTKGEIKKQDMDILSEVQVKDEEPQPLVSTPPPPRKEKKPRPRRTLHGLLLTLAVVLVFGGVGYGVWRGTWEAGSIAVDELTSVAVTLNINSRPEQIYTNATTVEGLLNERRIRLDENDYIGQDMEQPLSDGMTIWLRLSIPITVHVDGEMIMVESQPITVAEALDLAGVNLTPRDELSLPLLSYIYQAADIRISRVNSEVITVDESIEPPVLTQEYTYLAPGSSETVSGGRAGIRRSTYEITYRDGEEIKRKLVNSVTVSEPEAQIVGVGPSETAIQTEYDEAGNPVAVFTATTENGATFYYTEQFTVETTAYTWTGNNTFTGTVPKVGTIAVDPTVIPLNTKVYIVGYGFATAEDTGGAVKGNIVDLYMDTETECINWGRRNATMYILAQ